MTLESVSRSDFSTYATGVSRMVSALNDRAAENVNRLHESGPQPMEARATALETVQSAVGIFDQISDQINLGIERVSASRSQAAAAYQAQV